MIDILRKVLVAMISLILKLNYRIKFFADLKKNTCLWAFRKNFLTKSMRKSSKAHLEDILKGSQEKILINFQVLC